MRWVMFFIVSGAIAASALPVRAQTNVWASYEVFGEKEGFQNYYGPGYITSDKQGLLWIGGDNGLYSFDGTHFTNYLHTEGNDSSLPFNVVRVNYQDKAGNYWVALPNSGLFNFNPVNRSFRRFQYTGIDRFNIHKYRVNCFLEDGDLLWMVLAGYGLACWDRRTLRMQHYRICPTGNCGSYYSASWITAIIKDPADSCLWLGSNDGLIQYWPSSGSLKIYRPPVLMNSAGNPSGNVFNILLFDQKGMLWCGTWGQGLLSFSCATKKFTCYRWRSDIRGTSNICSGIFIGSANQLWVGSLDEGLLLFDKISGAFRKVRMPGKPDEIIPANMCYQTNRYTIWIADQKKLYRYNLDTSRFAWYPLETSPPQKKAGGVYNFILTEGKLFTGIFYDGGFGWYNRATNRHFPRPLTQKPDNESVLHLAKDHDGTVWIATPGGTYLYDPRTDKLLSPKRIDSSDAFFNAHCRFTLHARDGSHWLVTTKGLVQYDPVKSILKVFDTLQPAKHRLPDRPVYSLYEDSKSRIWIGTRNEGIACYMPATDSLIHLKLNLSPLHEVVEGICEDKDGRMLLLFESYGLVILEKPFIREQKITICNRSNYLPTDYISYVFRDNKDRIWLNAANGLLLFDPETKHYTSFKQEDGLVDNFIDSYPYQDSLGLMYLGFSNGFQTFHPDSLLASPLNRVHIRLNNLIADGKEWPQHPAYIPSITLQPHQLNVAFSFAAVSSALSAHYTYAYMLDGLDKDWNYTGTNTTGQYNNLPPGKYTLRIKAAIGNNQWISEYFGMPVTVLPAWYQTLWFKVLVALVMAAFVYGFFRYRVQQVRHEAALKESFHQKINELEMRTLRAQMNPHFIFNSLSSINRYIVKSDHKTASGYLTRFSKLIRLILDNSATDIISIEKELQTLQLYIDMEMLRFDHAFTYALQVDENIDIEDTYIPSMLLQPYVENAIWHGLLHKDNGKGVLLINITQSSPTMLTARIQDNGVGRQKAKEMKSKEAVKKKSYGMQISHDRLELLNRLKHQSSSVIIEDLVADDGTGCGTLVILHIPVQNKPI